MVLADDQDLIRAGLRALLAPRPDVVVVGEARNGIEAVQQVAALRPHVVLMDVRMPGLSGVEATVRIKALPGPSETRVLVVTTFEEAEVARACRAAGADGFIGKGFSTDALVQAIHAVARGRAPVSRRVARREPAERGAPTLDDIDLTPRELGIVRLAALGLTNDEIGRRLDISSATVKTHVRNAMRKLGSHDRAGLVALAHRLGAVADLRSGR
ncbi:response regulator transcription factor [Rathayibacter sp. VKM Ac-2805]|uniref:response regulator transcription factor n=1 Tax=Rathayibacter sp. VKM Ac-2805 TaxID=2609258 RepID=UPI001FC9BD2A|nr:response regulator transcription factor [Rathayibacter sp. VKM Ac-2805]